MGTRTTAAESPLHWMVRLRWGAVAGQAAIISVALASLDVDLPTAWLFALVAVTAATNLVLAGRQSTQAVLAGIIILDIFLLTAMLALTGGAANPFSIFYLVHVALSAVLLSPLRTWGVAFLSTVCFGSLFFIYRPIDALHSHHSGDHSLHLTGMWIAFVVAAALVAYFQTEMSRAVRRRDELLQRAEERAARLSAVTNLAAGAAHELGTPLATIAVVASELRSQLSGVMREDAELLLHEVQRCREAIQRMSLSAGETIAEAPAAVELNELGATLEQCLGTRFGERLSISKDLPHAEVTVPLNALVQAVAALVKNALDASAALVSVHLSVRDGALSVRVKDDGKGMDQETLLQLGSPFFSTKGPDDGMGLGVFLVQSFAERLGGNLTYRSAPGSGTEANLSIPAVANL